MTELREMLSSSNYLDRDEDSDRYGDVLPYADIASEYDHPPVQNSSIIQGGENLKNYRIDEVKLEKFEAGARRAREQAISEAALQNAGVYVTLEQYYQDRLDLLDFVSGSLMRRGFRDGGSKKPEVQDRYKENLPNVEAGAHRNHVRQVNVDLPKIYHADELIAAGFEPQEVMFDAKTTMRVQAQEEFGGPANKKKRAKLREKLKRKRDSFRQ